MKLTDLAPLDRWIEFEKDIHQKSGLDVNVFDTKGYRISEFKSGQIDYALKLKRPIKDKVLSAPPHI